MSAPLAGRVVAVTGASSGIGAATAVALADAGAAVAIGARRMDRLEALADRIGAAGGRAAALEVDLAVPDEARRFVERAATTLGGLDVLVNNAGVLSAGPFSASSPADWQRMLGVNVIGLLHCTQAALACMRERGGGHVVNISSVISRLPLPEWSVYSMTKAAVSAFTEALRPEAAAANVRVTLLEPGFTETEMTAADRVRPIVEALIRQRGTGLLQPEDVAAMVVHAIITPSRVSVDSVVMRPFRAR
jgi:NADP-dependent 3-hydroxy acid dehydrogenase YdfG